MRMYMKLEQNELMLQCIYSAYALRFCQIKTNKFVTKTHVLNNNQCNKKKLVTKTETNI